jgi:DNA-binding NtrC family response regulator
MIDLVMVDLDRSEHSSYVFIGELERRQPQWPVLVLSRAARHNPSQPRMNVKGILHKPFSLGTVSRAVADAMSVTARENGQT